MQSVNLGWTAAIRPRLLHRFDGETMGTRYRVALVSAEVDQVAAARTAVHAALSQVDELMSTYKPSSEVSRLNAMGAGQALRISPQTFAVLAQAQRVSEVSEGAFDVTAGPYVNAWGFGPVKQVRVPADDELAKLALDVGWRHLQLDPEARTVTKQRDALYVDLSAIAKGFGADEASRALSALGLHDHLVDVGGEVRACGRRADGQAWQVGVERPGSELPGAACHAVPLNDCSMATSGDYRICFHQDGRRYSHEIDPRKGRPVEHGLALVSVVAPDCMFADAMATALLVLGPEEGWALAQRLDLAAYFVQRQSDGGWRHFHSSAFTALGGRAL